jgi:hypothetical protein
MIRQFLTLGIGASQATITGTRRAMGYQQILNATLAASTGIVMPNLANFPGIVVGYAMIQSNGGAVRWRDDGVAPTATVGMLIPLGGELDYAGDVAALRFISSSGTPIVDVVLYA